MEEYIRQNDKKVDDLNNAFLAHLPIEDNRFKQLKDDFSELKKILLAQNDKSDDFNQKVDKHILRVEPVIKAYEDNIIFTDGLKKRGNSIIWTSSVATAVGVIWFLLIKGGFK